MRTVEQLAQELVRDPQYRDIFVPYKCMPPFKKCTADVRCKAPDGIAFFCSNCANEYNTNQEIREAVERGVHLIDNNLRSLNEYLNTLSLNGTTESRNTDILPAHIIREQIFPYLDKNSLLALRGINSNWNEYVKQVQRQRLLHKLRKRENNSIQNNRAEYHTGYSYELRVILTLAPKENILHFLFDALYCADTLEILKNDECQEVLTNIKEFDNNNEGISRKNQTIYFIKQLRPLVITDPFVMRMVTFEAMESQPGEEQVITVETYFFGTDKENIIMLKLYKECTIKD
jgi:hypothetical protein